MRVLVETGARRSSVVGSDGICGGTNEQTWRRSSTSRALQLKWRDYWASRHDKEAKIKERSKRGASDRAGHDEVHLGGVADVEEEDDRVRATPVARGGASWLSRYARMWRSHVQGELSRGEATVEKSSPKRELNDGAGKKRSEDGDRLAEIRTRVKRRGIQQLLAPLPPKQMRARARESGRKRSAVSGQAKCSPVMYCSILTTDLLHPFSPKFMWQHENLREAKLFILICSPSLL